MKYSIIYADPAWSFNNKNSGGSMKSGADAHYPTMTVDQIAALNVQEIAAEDCTLFMWWLASQPAEALYVLESWGFTLKTTTGFTWIKKTKNWLDHFGMGFMTRQGTENILIATRGKPKRQSASIRNVVRARTGQHSEKPDIFRRLIVELMGDLPRAELFARSNPPGWDTWGNETTQTEAIAESLALPRFEQLQLGA